MNRPSWDEYYMIIAKIVSSRSTCSNRHNGCIIVKDKSILSAGYNGAMPECDHCIDKNVLISKHNDKPIFRYYCKRRDMNIPDADKQLYCVASHAESNAISQAAKHGISLCNSIAYCTLSPCFTCLKTMVIAGVKEIVYEYEYESKNKNRDKFWKSQMQSARIKFRQLWITDNSMEIFKKSLEFPTGKRLLDATN